MFVFLVEVRVFELVVLGPDHQVAEILLVAEQHLGPDVVEESAFRLQKFYYFRKIFKRNERFTVLFYSGFHLLKDVRVSCEENRHILELIVDEGFRELVYLLGEVAGAVEVVLEEMAALLEEMGGPLVLDECESVCIECPRNVNGKSPVVVVVEVELKGKADGLLRFGCQLHLELLFSDA